MHVLYLKTNMLWLSIGMHIGWNFFQGPILGFGASGHKKLSLLDLTVLDPAWLSGAERVGVTAGASAPEVRVSGVVERLRSLGGQTGREREGRAEDVYFPLPRALQTATDASD